jgi:acyl-CoA thioesterase-1
MQFRFFTLFLLAALVSCSKPETEAKQTGPAPANSPAAPEAPLQPDPRPVIVAFGDSLTAGYGLDAGLSYPDLLQKALDAKGLRYRVVNQGISGDTTSGGVSRIDAALSMNPAIVILELGANDGLRGLPVANTRANLEEMITAFQNGGAKVLLAGITLPRNYGADYIREFDAVYKDLAAKYKLAYLPFLLEGVAMNAQYMQSDALHPNAKGTERVSRNVLAVLEPMLER